MNKIFAVIGIIYILAANVYAVYLTVHDKKASMTNKKRVSENTLMIVAALSGCVGMYLAMRVIHHKTKHPKFMLGIPAIFIAEVIIAVLLIMIIPK